MAYAYPKRGIEALNEEQLANYNNYIKMGYLNEPALGAAFNNISPERYLGSITAYGATNNTGLGTVTGSTNNENYGVNMDINEGASSTDVVNAINEYTRKMDEYNAEERAYRKYINDLSQKNWTDSFDFEKDKFKQQLKENEITRTREDTVYQRTMQDLALAGINPLMVGKLGTDPTSLGQVAGNAPTAPSLHSGTPSPIQSQAGVIAQEINSLRDYKIMQKQIKLDQEKLKEEERRNKSEERIKESEIKLEINKLYKEISIARNQLKSANVNAAEERKLKRALQESENAHDIIMEFIKYGNSKNLQDDAQEAEKNLQDSINKIKSIETGNKIVDTVVNVAIEILKYLR